MKGKQLNVLVSGAAGRTGRHVCKQAVGRGQKVTALARRPKRLESIEKLHRTVDGDATNPEIICAGLDNKGLVIIAVGSSEIPPCFNSCHERGRDIEIRDRKSAV